MPPLILRLLVATLLVAPLSLSGRMPEAGALSTVTVTVDADPNTAGVQASRAVAVGAAFSVDILIGSISDLQAFNLELEYNQAAVSAPTISTGSDLDRNPDVNQTFLSSTGRSWSCSPPPPSGDIDPSPSVGAAFLSCFSTGGDPGPDVGAAETLLATVQFNAVAAGSSPLTLRNVNTFKASGVETGSCNPVVVTAATCTDASITVSSAISVGGGWDFPDVEESPEQAETSAGSSSLPFVAIAGGIAAALALAGGSWLAWRRRIR